MDTRSRGGVLLEKSPDWSYPVEGMEGDSEDMTFSTAHALGRPRTLDAGAARFAHALGVLARREDFVCVTWFAGSGDAPALATACGSEQSSRLAGWLPILWHVPVHTSVRELCERTGRRAHASKIGRHLEWKMAIYASSVSGDIGVSPWMAGSYKRFRPLPQGSGEVEGTLCLLSSPILRHPYGEQFVHFGALYFWQTEEAWSA
jgi:hypothetical protein